MPQFEKFLVPRQKVRGEAQHVSGTFVRLPKIYIWMPSIRLAMIFRGHFFVESMGGRACEVFAGWWW